MSTTRDFGQEGFLWFIGTVEDRNDPLKLGRVRVRIMNVHGNSREHPTDTLPWAVIMNSVHSASTNVKEEQPGTEDHWWKTGVAPVGLNIRSTVVGFFLDGTERNQPVVMGTINGIPDNWPYPFEDGKGPPRNHDVPEEAREINTVPKTIVKDITNIEEDIIYEPITAYKAKYPYNKVTKTERGHVFEVDDTPDNERVHQFIRGGAYDELATIVYEVDNKKFLATRRIEKTTDNKHEVDLVDRTVWVGRDEIHRVQNNRTDSVGNNVTQSIGNNVTQSIGNNEVRTIANNQTETIKGNVLITVEGNYDLNVTGNVTINGKRIDLNP